jgi:hypothetical protein
MNAITKEEQTALTLPQRAAVALGESANETKLRELVAKSASILTVTNADGREEAHRAGMVLLKTRTSIDKAADVAVADAKGFVKAVGAKKVELIAIIQPEEVRVMALRDGWDEQIAAEKAAKIAAERLRVERITDAIAALREDETDAIRIFKTAEAVGETLAYCLARPVTIEIFQERHAEALEIHAAVAESIRAVLAERQASEAAAIAAEEARKAEAKRADDEAAAVAAQRAENERVANDLAIAAKRLADQEAAQALVAKQLADKAAANLRAENEARDTQVRIQREAQEKNQMALSQIEAIRHQAVIAEAGRSPYVKGGDAASYLFVLAETRAWVIDDEQFGVLTASAQMVKDSTIVMIEQGLASCIAADHAEALIENAQFDIDREAERVRKQAMADQHLTDKRNLPRPESASLHDEMVDAGMGIAELSDEDIIEFGKEWELDLQALVARMERFVVDQRELAEVVA